MSDALTDIARDERRGREFRKYLEFLYDYLFEPTQERKDLVINQAENVDNIRRGYWGGITNLSKDISKLDSLLKKDKITWCKLLIIANEFGEIYKKLKKLSPFNDKLFLYINYGIGCVHYSGDFFYRLNEILMKNNYKTYDCQKYCVFLPITDENEITIIQTKE